MSETPKPDSGASAPRPTEHAAPQARVLDAETLFAGEQVVLIRNGDVVYRLRRTRQGKLILNK